MYIREAYARAAIGDKIVHPSGKFFWKESGLFTEDAPGYIAEVYMRQKGYQLFTEDDMRSDAWEIEDIFLATGVDPSL